MGRLELLSGMGGILSLVLDNYDLIKQAGLPEVFEDEDDDVTSLDPEYGND